MPPPPHPQLGTHEPPFLIVGASLPAKGRPHGISPSRRRYNASGGTVGDEISTVLVVVARPGVARLLAGASRAASKIMVRFSCRGRSAAAHKAAAIFAADGSGELAGSTAAAQLRTMSVMSKTIVDHVGVSNCKR